MDGGKTALAKTEAEMEMKETAETRWAIKEWPSGGRGQPTRTGCPQPEP